MSEAATKSFFEAIGKDAALKGDAEQAKSLDQLAAVARDKGYDVTTDDLVMVAEKSGQSVESKGGEQVLAASICASVGCIACVSIGS
ncbi:Nif11-like leader peptide family natural product precursor [Thiococcus pfennigii]|jgi:predicted ribosomally synthesized peptide with nif11-like leader|uniref:Nif11-like leader peptide family natural product precursor n=1 Tax=Thiococcus pfennigii TaxID=1057 RepID=UPI001908D3CE|nr:Nif11-like leader peptide family natural product precursor [Thiococcus pfennigii]MBK1700601.1 hypothetical protein [Thiococcus pfennigii]MBK1732551.1 hypothetical protein [Thiococcus pfennigii]